MGTLAGSLTGCGGVASGQGNVKSHVNEAPVAVSGLEYGLSAAGSAESFANEVSGSASAEDRCCSEDAKGRAGSDSGQTLKEQLACYEPFGMTYDAKKNVLSYKGKRVRYFEDYYPVGEDGQGGIDFFDEKGVVDVCAIRDFSGIVRNADGSFDPSGRVAGLRQCSDAEFEARDMDVVKNPQAAEAFCGEALSETELLKIAEEYREFGVTYEVKEDAWYYKGEKVRRFLDVLTTNGADLASGGFQGTLRQYWQDGGTVDICAVRDYDRKNGDGSGRLIGVEMDDEEVRNL